MIDKGYEVSGSDWNNYCCLDTQDHKLFDIFLLFLSLSMLREKIVKIQKRDWYLSSNDLYEIEAVMLLLISQYDDYYYCNYYHPTTTTITITTTTTSDTKSKAIPVTYSGGL
jgi:hypothetical protein